MAQPEFLARLRERINKSKQDIVSGREEIVKAEEAGIDVTEQKRKMEKVISDIQRIESTYFPKK